MRKNQTASGHAIELQKLAAHYIDLFDLAPMGYFTLNETGLVMEANLTAETLLGAARGDLARQPLTRFILPEDQDIFYRHYKNLFDTNTPQTCELRMLHSDGTPFWVQLDATATKGAQAAYLAVFIDITERKQLEDAQSFLLQCGFADSGDSFFNSLATYLARNLGMDYVCIDRLDPEGLSAQTVAVYFDGKFEDNMTYTLKDTPCGEVVGRTICCFDRGVRHLFPQDVVLQEMKAESYVGTTLWSFDGKPIGLIAVIGRRPLEKPRLAESMLKMAAVRAAGELERRQAMAAIMDNEKKLQKSHEVLENRVKERTLALSRNNALLLQEIEERRQMEQRIVEVSELIQKIFDASPLGILAYEASGQCVMVNEAAERIIGAGREAVLLQNFNHLESWEKSGLLTAAREVIQTNQSRENIELHLVTTYGRDVTLNCSLIPFSSANKMHLLLMGQDISRQKLADAALLQNQKLAAIGLLVASIAHEISNPNGFIVFNLPILRDYLQELIPIVDGYMADHPDRRLFGRTYADFRNDIFKLMDNIEHGAHRINSTVAGLKDFSRKREKLEPRRIALRQAIENAVSFCRGEISKNVKSLRLDIPDNLPPIRTDPEAVEQILVNLLINAAHASDKEESWIRLSVNADCGKPDRCIIQVDDNGFGMDKKTMKRIFDPFYTKKTSYQGTGLGLYICQILAEGLGGRIEVESQPARGSSFKVILNDF